MASNVTLDGYVLNFITKVDNPDGTQKWVYGIDKSGTYPPKAHNFTLTFTICNTDTIIDADASPGESIGVSFSANTATFTWNGEGTPLSKQFSFTTSKTYTEDPTGANVTLTDDSPSSVSSSIMGPSCTEAPPSRGIDFRSLKDIDLYEE